MFYVKLQGGLGNQMFQYAFYIALVEANLSAVFDISYYDNFSSHQGYELFKIFDIQCPENDIRKIKQLASINNSVLSRLRRKLFPKKTHYVERVYSYEYNFEKIIRIGKSFDVYLDGYWEDERYFNNSIKSIKKIFIFKHLETQRNIEIMTKIKNSNSVSLHIRRGDKINSKLHINLDLSYYLEAIKIISDKVPDLNLFIFSDDLSWVNENLVNLPINLEIIDWNRGSESYIDMHLMSLCKHNIIASSTFSWWAAYLNSNPNKIVIAPKHFFTLKKRQKENTGFIPSSWIQI